jgi:prevent-host-death family protein
VDYNKVVTKINVHDAKTNLSKYLDRVEAGETIIVCRHNRPIAALRPLPPEAVKRKPRVPGFDKGKFTIPPEFFEPMSEEELSLWEGPLWEGEIG